LMVGFAAARALAFLARTCGAGPWFGNTGAGTSRLVGLLSSVFGEPNGTSVEIQVLKSP